MIQFPLPFKQQCSIPRYDTAIPEILQNCASQQTTVQISRYLQTRCIDAYTLYFIVFGFEEYSLTMYLTRPRMTHGDTAWHGRPWPNFSHARALQTTHDKRYSALSCSAGRRPVTVYRFLINGEEKMRRNLVLNSHMAHFDRELSEWKNLRLYLGELSTRL